MMVSGIGPEFCSSKRKISAIHIRFQVHLQLHSQVTVKASTNVCLLQSNGTFWFWFLLAEEFRCWQNYPTPQNFNCARCSEYEMEVLLDTKNTIVKEKENQSLYIFFPQTKSGIIC